MEHSDKINMLFEFADGTLDPSKEDQLFLMLSSDDELRQQFKSHIGIKNSVRTGTGNVLVPGASKAAVFAGLGLDLPQSANTTEPPSNKLFYTAAGVSLLLTAFLLLFQYNGNNEKRQLHIAKFDIMKNVTQIIPTDINRLNIPSVSSKEINTQRADVHNTIGIKYANINAEGINLNNADIEEGAEETSKNTIILELSAADFNSPVASIVPELLPANSILSNTDEYKSLFNTLAVDNNYGLSVEFRNSRYSSIKTATISPKEYSPVNNMAIAVSYSLNNNFSIGLDIRQETFFLQYRGTKDSKQFIYEQQPNFTTFTSTLKYSLNEINNWRPFAQVSLGINNLGFVSRAMLGTEYSVLDNFSLILGVDFNNLTYSYQKNYFNSSKIGLNYGLIYSF